jgi:hypothetical protein
MRACNVTRETCRRGEDGASFETPCKDEDEVEDKRSGATRAQTVCEATGAGCNMNPREALSRGGCDPYSVKAARMLGGALNRTRFRVPFQLTLRLRR